MSNATAPLRTQWLTVLCYLAMMSLAIGLNLLPVFLTTLSHLYGGADGLSKEELGRLGAVGFTGLVVGILVTGPLADRAGAKPFALLGNACIAVSLVGLALAPTYAWLTVAMLVLGLGAGILDMVLSPIVAALHPERRGAAMNWLHSFYCVGAGVTIFVGTIGLQAGLGWRGTCLVLLPLPLGLMAAFAPLRFPTLVSDGGRTPFFGLVRQPWFLGALVAIFLGGATEAGMAQWLPAYAEMSLGFSTWIGGTALLLFSLAMALGRMVVGAVGPRWNPYLVMAWGCGLSAVLFLAASFLPWSGAALTAAIVVGVTGSCLWPTLLAVTADRHPDGGASMFGALAALGNAGGIVLPWLVGWVADRHSLAIGLAWSAVAPGLMLPLVLLLRRFR
ncbi:MAG: MFS transporter [Opitutaceae bacterium]|nr:MFS transporter [Opitutaceae bacterium]